MRWTEAVTMNPNSRDVLRPFYPAQTLASRLSARSTWALCGLARLKMDWYNSRSFWIWFISAGVDFAGSESLKRDEEIAWDERWETETIIQFDLSPSFALKFIVCGTHELFLIASESHDQILIGNMDSHQMSDTFRWVEYQQLTEAIRCNVKSIPTWAIELLLIYYVAPLPEDLERILSKNNQLLNDSGCFTSDEAELISNYSRKIVRKEFEWQYDNNFGWHAVGKSAYTYRKLENQKTFPFHVVKRFLETIAA